MEKLTEKEQVLLTYYVCNFLGNKKDDRELAIVLKNGLTSNLPPIQQELKEEGFLGEHDQMITNEGILHIDSILHIQSYATEGNKLAYIKDSLQINEIELSVEELKNYIYKHIGMDQPTIH